MQKLREFLEEIIRNRARGYDPYADFAQKILSEYLTDSKFCQCELCKKQHELIGLQ